MVQSDDIVYGIHPVLELMRSGERSLNKLYVLKGRGGQGVEEIIQMARAQGIALHFENKATLDRLAAKRIHQGVVAKVAPRRYDPPEALIELARQKNEAPLILILDGLEDPRNLGAIIRTAEAAAAHGIILPRHRSVGLTGTVVKASAGAAEHLAIARVTNLRNAVEHLKKEGLWIVGLEPEAVSPYTSVDYREPVGIVLGAESKGIREGLIKHCDYRVHLPMKGKVNSLNVSVAAGIVLYEVMRQRSSGPSKP